MLIAQISDLQVRPRGQLYHGVADSNRMLGQAMEHLHGLDRKPDLLLITGDLTDKGSPGGYAELRRLLAPLQIPFVVMHHPPFSCGFPYMDDYRCMDPAPLERVLRSAGRRALRFCVIAAAGDSLCLPVAMVRPCAAPARTPPDQ